jgi:hypothetical protein
MTSNLLDKLKPNNDRYLRSLGRLKYFAAPTAVVCVGTPGDMRKVVHIAFDHRDGSVYIQTPYFKHGTHGLLRELDPISAGKSTTVEFMRGVRTSSLVKLSHHPDGNVHFSQDGKVFRNNRRLSFRLDGPIGHLFEVHAYDLAGFEALTALKSDRVHLPFVLPDHATRGVTIVGEWRRKKDIRASMVRGTDQAGPLLNLVDRKSGAPYQAFTVGQPLHFPLRDHVLTINCGEAPAVESITEPTMVLMGGWDFHEVEEIGKPVPPLKGLIWVYPHHLSEEALSQIPSVDFTPGVAIPAR